MLVQSALWSHVAVPVVHSSISGARNNGVSIVYLLLLLLMLLPSLSAFSFSFYCLLLLLLMLSLSSSLWSLLFVLVVCQHHRCRLVDIIVVDLVVVIVVIVVGVVVHGGYNVVVDVFVF